MSKKNIVFFVLFFFISFYILAKIESSEDKFHKNIHENINKIDDSPIVKALFKNKKDFNIIKNNIIINNIFKKT